MTTVRPLAILAAFLAFAGPPSIAPVPGPLVAAAQAEESAAADLVRTLGDNVIQVLKKEPVEGRKQKLRDLFTGAFDVDTMAKFTAGTYWRRADAGQQQEYLKLFGDYVATLYANKFGDYTGQEFKVTGQRASSENDIAVESTIVQTNKPPVKVDFRVRKAAAGFKIVDVYVEGISLLITKRDEFTTVLAREGMGGLLTRLRSTAQG